MIVADLGRGTSRAFLLEQVAGAFRFVAKAEGPTTATSPIADLTVGWLDLLRQLEWETGRRLVLRDGLLTPMQDRGDGVDGLLICSTLGEPVRVALLESGGMPIAGALAEVLKRSHARVFHIAAPSGRKDTGWAATQAEALRAFRPEMVILVLASDQAGAAPRLIQVARQVAAAGGVTRAFVVADGVLRDQAANVFPTKTKLRLAEPKTKPVAELTAELGREMDELYATRLAQPDFRDLARESSEAIVVRPHAVDLVNRFIARAYARRVVTIGIDDGCHAHWAGGDGGALAHLPHLDLGVGIASLTSREVADAARWLPFPAAEDDLMTWVLNRSIRPWTSPEDPRDLAIEQAMARQVGRRALVDIARAHPLALSGSDLVVGGPAFARWNQPGAAALALLDTMDVVPDQGVLDLALDQDGLMAVAGTLGVVQPALASDIFEYDGLTHLGSAVVIGGTPQDGELACRGEIHYETGEMGSFSVASGTVAVLPLRPGETATLVLRPERKFSVGGNPSGKPVTLSDQRRIIGGTVGVILDARGRPLGAGATPIRHTRVKQWLDAVNGITPTAVRRATGELANRRTPVETPSARRPTGELVGTRL